MNYAPLAQHAIALIEKVSVPATLQNAQIVTAIHDMLSQIAAGQLILSPAKPVPPKE